MTKDQDDDELGRFEIESAKVLTKFGSLYAHVTFNSRGGATEVSFSSPGKFYDTEVGLALVALGAAVTRIIRERIK